MNRLLTSAFTLASSLALEGMLRLAMRLAPEAATSASKVLVTGLPRQHAQAFGQALKHLAAQVDGPLVERMPTDRFALGYVDAMAALLGGRGSGLLPDLTVRDALYLSVYGLVRGAMLARRAASYAVRKDVAYAVGTVVARMDLSLWREGGGGQPCWMLGAYLADPQAFVAGVEIDPATGALTIRVGRDKVGDLPMARP